MNSVGIVTIGNEGFFPGVVALIKSIRRNCPMPITVIDEGFSNEQKNILLSLNADLMNVHRAIPINSERFVCCYAFFDIDQAPYDTIIYLDADTIVLQDISELFIKAKKNGVVCSPSNPAKSLEKKFPFNSISEIIKKAGRTEFLHDLKKEFGSFTTFHKQFAYPRLNTGVVALNKNVLKQIKQSLPKYSKYFSRLQYPDQDLFSLLLAEYGIRPAILPYWFNVTRLHGHPVKSLSPKPWQAAYYGGIDISINEGQLTLVRNKIKGGIGLSNIPAKVLHFNSIEKPWRNDVVLREGFKELWQYYYTL
jgi:lipopolysaccharide biosynthesis glycosyltransferase